MHLLIFGAASIGCATTQTPKRVETGSLDGSGRDNGDETSSGDAAALPGQSPGQGSQGSAAWLEDGRPSDPTRALPRLSFRHLGMHIGGGPNDAESKGPWLGAIEAGSVELLSCYVHVQKPEQGGSYGVDLYVGRKGGAPEVRGSRQKLGGEPFDACMHRAFSSLQFIAPEKPTVLSYSLIFEMSGGLN